MDRLVREDGASDDQVIGGAEFSEELSILILCLWFVFAHDEFSVHVVSAYFGIEVSHEEFQVPFWSFVQNGLKLFVEFVFFFFVRYIGVGIALTDGDFPAFTVESGCQDP